MSSTSFLNSSVQSQGIKVDFRAWLDMGSQEWKETPEKVKAYAYQAAKVCGWTDAGLKKIILDEFTPRVDDFMANVTMDTLQALAEQFPAKVEQIREVKQESPTFKFGN